MDTTQSSVAEDSEARVGDAELEPLLGAQRMKFVVLHSGASLALPAGLTGAIVPLIGQVMLSTPESSVLLARGELACLDSERPSEVRCAAGGLCVAVLAAQKLWAHAARGVAAAPGVVPLVLPAVHELPPALRDAAQQVVHERDSRKPGTAQDARLWAEAICDLQTCFDGFVARCPGRTTAARRRVFQRLERVRAFIRSNVRADLNVQRLAKIANYTLAHFIRLFSAVYGETPYAFGINCRIERARPLIVSTDLAIEEIARAVGFESRTAFYRAFRTRFGCSASRLRAQARHDRATRQQH